jgi:hypothetical protein
MINLIPNEEKKKMVRGFQFRFITLSLAMAGLSTIIATITILPSYFISTQKNYLIDKRMSEDDSSVEDLSSKSILNTVTQLNTEMSLVEKNMMGKFVVSEKIINGILLKKPLAVKVTDISYESSLSGGLVSMRKASVYGIASNREVLIDFRRKLEDSGLFSRVDLPISNFVKGSNIKFFLSVIPKVEKNNI